jgi:hypothetical protein
MFCIISFGSSKIVFQIDGWEIRREVETTTEGDQAFLMEIP